MDCRPDHRRDVVTGRCVPLRGNDIDTDRIIPARFAKAASFDALGAGVFADDRQAMAEAKQAHPFDDERFSGASLLLVNDNFGCGSSREHAVAALMRWEGGIKAIVGESFSTIFAANCLANGIPAVTGPRAEIEALMASVEADPLQIVRLDLQALRLAREDGTIFAVALAPGPRRQLVEGTWDLVTRLLGNTEAVRAKAASLPYLCGYSEYRSP